MTKIGTYLLKYLVRKVSFEIKTGHKLDSVKFFRMNPKTFDDKIPLNSSSKTKEI